MGIYRGTVTLDHPVIGGTGTNTWHVRTVSDLEQGNSDLLALTDLLEAFYSNGEGLWCSGLKVGFSGEWTKVGDNPTVNSESEGFDITVPGSNQPAPPVLNIVAGWRTPLATRSGKGRSFLGPLSFSAIGTDGTPTDNVVSAFRGTCQTLVDDSMGLANGAFVVYSQKTGLARDFTSVVIRDKFAVLRSRRD